VRHNRANTRAISTAWLVAAVFFACSKDALGPDAGSVETVIVSPPTAIVSVGANLTLQAEVLDANGNAVESPRISWASADTSIADVTQSGVVTGRKLGTVLIAASARGKDAFARITVNPTPVAGIRLSLTHRAMLVGETVQLEAEAVDARGAVLAGRAVAWSSSQPAVATVTDNGLVNAIAPGAAIITASSEGKTAVASITVSLVPVASIVVSPNVTDLVVGQSSQLTARVLDASGATLSGRTVAWSTNLSSVATVSSQGLVTAVASGTATITATSEGRSASATVNVGAQPVSAVIVSPGQMTIFAGQSVQLSALVTDDRGQVLSGRPVTFSSSNSQVATVSSGGLVTGVSAGSTTITATSEGATGTATVTIAPEPVAAVEVTPATVNLFPGSGSQLGAVARNVNGQVLTGRTVLWSSSSPSIVSVSASGFVTGLTPGDAVIIATIEGKQGSASVTVRSVPVATVTVSPATASTTVGQSVTLTATTLDAAGTTLTGRIVGWSSSDNTIATVSSTGVVTGVANGSATITASSEGQSGTAVVTVAAVPVASVAVTPAQATLSVGQSAQLSATAMDVSGQTLAGRTTAWASANASVATVSGSGVVTGVGGGTTTITATIDGVAGSASVTVNPPAPAQVASVTVSPSTATVSVGSSVSLTATARDGSGNVMSNAPITWSSSNAAVASVSANGVVSGVAPGAVTVTATSGSASGTASITVPTPPVGRIVVTPSNPRIDEGDTIQMTATVYDVNDKVMTGVTVTWKSSNTKRATVDSNGLVRGIQDGNATITASAGGKSGSTTVRVDD
jgi:uncharacterized protein YjdB